MATALTTDTGTATTADTDTARPRPGRVHGPGYGPPRRRRGALDEEDLAAYLEDLEGEIGRVREELESMRRSRAPEQS